MYADEPRPRGLARRGDRPKVGGVRGGRQPSRWSVAPFPCPWVPWAGGGRGTRGDAPPAPDAVAHPTPPRYAPVGGPHPPPTTARSRIFWFFGCVLWLDWCVAVVLRLLRLCDGMFLQLFAGICRSRVCCWPFRVVFVLAAGCVVAPASLRSLGRRFDFVPRLASSSSVGRAGGCSSPTIRAGSLRVPV